MESRHTNPSISFSVRNRKQTEQLANTWKLVTIERDSSGAISQLND